MCVVASGTHNSDPGVDACKIQGGLPSKAQGGNWTGKNFSERDEVHLILKLKNGEHIVLGPDTLLDPTVMCLMTKHELPSRRFELTKCRKGLEEALSHYPGLEQVLQKVGPLAVRILHAALKPSLFAQRWRLTCTKFEYAKSLSCPTTAGDPCMACAFYS